MSAPVGTTEVLIAGAGPTGLTLALTLKKLGVDCVLVDPALAPTSESRATVMHAGSLERLSTLGVAEKLIVSGAVIERFELRSRGRLVGSNDFTELPSRFRMLLSIPQSTTETVLEKALASDVQRGWAVDDFSPGDAGVRVEVKSDDETRPVTARFLVGCDGAQSHVRSKLQRSFTGTVYPEELLVADCRIDGLPGGNLAGWFLDEGTPFMIFTPLPDGLTRIGAAVPSEFAPTDTSIAELIRQRSDGQFESSDVVWASLFKTHRRLVDRMRHGRVLLAGDAAHMHSPAGGQGMNLGIRDAFDLGHRLAGHLRGELPIDTLDQYDEQRRSEAQQVLKNTERLMKLLTAAGARRRITDTVMRLGDKLVGLPNRIMIQASGINTPWPPGASRPVPE